MLLTILFIMICIVGITLIILDEKIWFTGCVSDIALPVVIISSIVSIIFVCTSISYTNKDHMKREYECKYQERETIVAAVNGSEFINEYLIELVNDYNEFVSNEKRALASPWRSSLHNPLYAELEPIVIQKGE